MATAVAVAATADRPRPEMSSGRRASQCPLCGAADPVDDTTQWWSGVADRDLTMSRCTRCGTRFADPMPDASVLEAAYPDDFYGRRTRDTERIEQFFLSRRLSLVGELTGRRVLDVGSGDGKFLVRARAAGATVRGVEPSATGRAASADVGVATVAALDELPADERYDVITAWHVVEHVADPVALVERISGLAAPGGRVVLALPNVESWEAERFGPDWFHLDLPRHVVFPTEHALVHAAHGAGLSHRRTSRYSIEYDPYGLLQSWWNRIGGSHNALYHRLKRKWPLSAYDTRARRQVLLGLATLPITAPLAVAASFVLSRRSRAGTYTVILERAPVTGSAP